MSHAADSAANREARSFGLRGASVDPALEALLSLGQWVMDDTKASVFLAGITRPALRRLFPPYRQLIRTIAMKSGLDLDADVSDVFAASAALGWLQEADDFELFMSQVGDGAIVVDVGANFGLYAAHAALYAGPRGRIFAFEPEPESFELLVRNLAHNGLKERSTCIRSAVSAQPGRAEFHVAADSAFSGLQDTGRSRIVRTIETQVASLDSCPELRNLGSVDLMKIDVEGSEAGVLMGARELLRRSPNILVMFEFSHKNLDDESRRDLHGVLARLEDDGFAMLGRSRRHEALVVLRPAALEGKRSENVFLCRPDSGLRNRLNAVVQEQARRTITPEKAAALAFLKWEARESIARA